MALPALTAPQTLGLKRAFAAHVLDRPVFIQSKEFCACCFQTVRNWTVADALVRRGLLAPNINAWGNHNGTFHITPEGIDWVRANDASLAHWADTLNANRVTES